MNEVAKKEYGIKELRGWDCHYPTFNLSYDQSIFIWSESESSKDLSDSVANCDGVVKDSDKFEDQPNLLTDIVGMRM